MQHHILITLALHFISSKGQAYNLCWVGVGKYMATYRCIDIQPQHILVMYVKLQGGIPWNSPDVTCIFFVYTQCLSWLYIYAKKTHVHVTYGIFHVIMITIISLFHKYWDLSTEWKIIVHGVWLDERCFSLVKGDRTASHVILSKNTQKRTLQMYKNCSVQKNCSRKH